MNGSFAVRSLLTWMTRCAGLGSAISLVAMMLVTVADVTLRALFNLPITGAYDLVQLFLVGNVFLSIPDVFLRDENIVIDFVDHIVGRVAVALLEVVANVAALVFLAVLASRMIASALDAMQFGEVSPDLAIPMTVHWALMIAGVFLALLPATFRLVESVRSLVPSGETR